MNTKVPPFFLVWLSLCFLILSCHPATDNILSQAPYSEVAADLRVLIEREMENKGLPAVSIALVDDQDIVWAQGFGYADLDKTVPATGNTIYRVGSVSKLFTDIGVMQLVEKGIIDLDAPVTEYLPGFQPGNPFGTPVTLRQLMSHRSGLVREPPVGHYFDPSGPSLSATVESLNGTQLVYHPGMRIKYSNAAIATVGYVLEKIQGQPFSAYLRKAVLEPLGLKNSSFEPGPAIRKQLAQSLMWSYDGRTFPAPTFELGMAPAGSMYASVRDLGGFMSVLFNGGQGPGRQVLRPETLEEMWTPQFSPKEAMRGYGIGFNLSELDGRRMVGHGGAIYGFATQLHMLPEEKLGVVIVTSKDGANNVMRRLASHALRSMLAVRESKPLPSLPQTEVLSGGLARKLDGVYQHNGERIELSERNGRLFLWQGGARREVKMLDDTLITDDVLTYGEKIIPLAEDRISLHGMEYTRMAVPAPLPPPAIWQGLIGEYGWDHNVLFILEKDQQLYALIEWFFLYPLKELSQDTFAFPDYGLYHGERLVFQRDDAGSATQVEAAGIVFQRRAAGTEEGVTFKIEPVAQVDRLREEALAAKPPQKDSNMLQPDLVELIRLDSTLRLDIRYATTNNFMDVVFYEEPRAFMQRPAAEALVRVHQALKEKGYGLLIHDAYRPWYVTKMFWDATPEDMKIFVADPASGSIHNRGAAVDLTLFDLDTGRPVSMVSGYDEFSERAFPDYPGGTSRQRWHRELLRDAMEDQGFTVYPWEWWHYNFKDASRYPILDLRFEELGN